jgi:succinate dehydrogenase / fumarate reductase cytochrome b subunit
MTNLLRNLFGSSLGKKYLMAASGAVMVLFVLAHLAGNLQIFLGPEAINRYGNLLQTNTELLWPARCILLATIVIHIWAAVSLTRENRAARPVAYAQWQPTAASYASRTMLMSGLIVLFFIIYHLLHFTVMAQAVNLTGKNFDARPEFFDSQGRHDVYHMMFVGFSNPWVALFYVVAVGLLCLHLSHGIGAMFQSLGWKKRPYRQCLDKIALWLSVAIWLGYSSIPLAILTRLIQDDVPGLK